MRCLKLCCAVVGLVLLVACASGERMGAALPEPVDMWRDTAFAYQPELVTETRASLFALEPDVVQALRFDSGGTVPVERRLDLLVNRFYGTGGIRLAYDASNTTAATQTWRNRKGDCLSLTILAYAAARHLGIAAHMQEVRVPLSVDRRDGMDFISGHVNVFVRDEAEVSFNGKSFGAGSFIIDFEPQAGSRRFGQWLSEDAILARYYNNRAAQYWAQKDDTRAYAYYRAAITTAPDFAPAYANLAQLYARHGLDGDAEHLLRHAVALGGPTYAPLRALHRLVLAQGRTQEAQQLAELLAKRQDEDPYHWLGLGLDALQAGRNREAIAALEKAAALTTGFEEIHYHLGLAYWRDGQREAARKQLAVLSAINNRDPGIAVLSKKLQGIAPQSAVF
jgi:Flp pilus assembly protein TadD